MWRLTRTRLGAAQRLSAFVCVLENKTKTPVSPSQATPGAVSAWETVTRWDRGGLGQRGGGTWSPEAQGFPS